MSQLSARSTLHAVLLGFSAALLTSPFFSIAAEDPGDGSVGPEALGITDSFGKWPVGLIQWVYNSTNAPADFDDGTMLQIFSQSLRQWEGYCDVLFVFGGIDDTADSSDFNDGVAVFEWDAGIGGAAGLAGPAWTTASMMQFGYWAYLDGSLKLNPTVFPGLGSTEAEGIRAVVGVRSTTVHEIGHLIGLGHSDQPESIMYANPYNSISHTVDDDILGCRGIYGHSYTYNPPDERNYTPPAQGVLTYDIIRISTGTDFPTEITFDDGTYPDSEFVAVGYQNTTGGYSDEIMYVWVDPYGYVSNAGQDTMTAPAFIGSAVMTFGRMRETPGMWTLYVYDSTGLQATLPFDVQTSVPVVNNPPTAELTYTENPSTRAVSLTTTVTGDAEGDNATIKWYIPSQGQIDVALGGSSGSDTRNVTFNDFNDWEMWAVVDDDSPRYTEDPPNTVGPAGPGFQSIYRYESNRNKAPTDLNGDSSSDVVWRNQTSGKNWLYKVKGNLIVESQLINQEADLNWEIAGLADFGGDGKTDILWRNQANGKNVLYTMDGDSITSIDVINVVNPVWEIVAIGDFNGDGRADILWQNQATGVLWMYLMDGATISSNSYVATEPDPDWQIFGTGDMNGDGNSDLLWRHGTSGHNWLHTMNGAMVLNRLYINKEGKSYWNIVGNGDYNGDGFADILWRHFLPGGVRSGWVWMYLMQGNTILASLPVAKEGDFNWTIAGNGDYNEDGYNDILWRNVGNGRNWMFQMFGNAILVSAPLTDANFVSSESNLDWEIQNPN